MGWLMILKKNRVMGVWNQYFLDDEILNGLTICFYKAEISHLYVLNFFK